MSEYSSYLASTTFAPYLQPMPGLGTSGRTLEAIILGGPRAGAGSASRIYNFAKATGGIDKIIYSPKFQALRDRYKLYGKSGHKTNLSIRYFN